MKNLVSASKYYSQAISIPIHCRLKPKDQNLIIKNIKKILN